MPWLLRYRVRHYVENSIWVFPLLSMAAAMVLVRVSYAIDQRLDWPSNLQRDATQAMLAASMFTFIVFVSSALLVAVQLASVQLTPRIIGIVFRNPVTKAALSVFVFTFVFTLSTLIRIQTSVPPLTVNVAAYACVFSLAVFFILMDQVGKSLRPSGALRSVAVLGREVIEHVYPHAISEGRSGPSPDAAQVFERKPTQSITSRKDGVVVAFDVAGLAAFAQTANCVVELAPQVGDHMAVGDDLLRIYGETTADVNALAQSVVVGFERTLEQDPTFAFRIMVDVASKGLSPAINDPTTAVLALDQIHHLLRVVGMRNLDTGEVRDSAGRLRLLYRTPDWEDFVRLAVTEIRHFGGESIQIARRLRAMLENLIQTLPASRTALLKQELALLKRSAERFFAEPEDRALAEVSDAQGVGGKRMRT